MEARWYQDYLGSPSYLWVHSRKSAPTLMPWAISFLFSSSFFISPPFFISHSTLPLSPFFFSFFLLSSPSSLLPPPFFLSVSYSIAQASPKLLTSCLGLPHMEVTVCLMHLASLGLLTDLCSLCFRVLVSLAASWMWWMLFWSRTCPFAVSSNSPLVPFPPWGNDFSFTLIMLPEVATLFCIPLLLYVTHLFIHLYLHHLLTYSILFYFILLIQCPKAEWNVCKGRILFCPTLCY